MLVKANSIWFQDSAPLTRWQELKKSGDSTKLKAYEDKVLSQRDGWQFVTQLTAKVLRYDPSDQQVNVEMTTPGRLLGTNGSSTPMLWYNDEALTARNEDDRVMFGAESKL